MEHGVGRFRIYALGVKAQCFTISLPLEVVITLFFEVLSDL